MPAQTIRFKAGDTFSVSGQLLSSADGNPPINITGYTIRSHIRASDQLVQDLSVAVTSAANGAYTISATPAQTAIWPVGICQMDIEFTSNTGSVVSSDTIYVNVAQDITQ